MQCAFKDRFQSFKQIFLQSILQNLAVQMAHKIHHISFLIFCSSSPRNVFYLAYPEPHSASRAMIVSCWPLWLYLKHGWGLDSGNSTC